MPIWLNITSVVDIEVQIDVAVLVINLKMCANIVANVNKFDNIVIASWKI